MRYYFVKFILKGMDKEFERSQVFGVDKSLNHIEAFDKIGDRINKAFDGNILDLTHITYLKELS